MADQTSKRFSEYELISIENFITIASASVNGDNNSKSPTPEGSSLSSQGLQLPKQVPIDKEVRPETVESTGYEIQR